MVRSAALYMVIVIALIIGVICSSLIMASGFYRLQYSKQLRYQHLEQNIASGLNILLKEPNTDATTKIGLFEHERDSILIARQSWGIFDVGVIRSFIQADTLNRVLTIANGIDSAKWAALYIIDEDRSISVSGKTAIKGNVYIPKAGIRPAYVDNQAYLGIKQIVEGHQYNSQKSLPALNAARLQMLKTMAADTSGSISRLPEADTAVYNWLQPKHVISLKNRISTLSNCVIKGHAIIHSDTLLIIDSTAALDNVIIFARSIRVSSGFKGKCQLFATDSILIGPRCQFDYPSAIGLLRFDYSYSSAARISIGDHGRLSGSLFAYEQHPDKVLPLIDLGENVAIRGQLYVQGNVGLHAGINIQGSVFCNRFIYTSGYTRYENYLINIRLDAPALSPYYLSSDLFPVSGQTQKTLEWLE